jgi:tetratricopeptide (TPR) repeat protein
MPMGKNKRFYTPLLAALFVVVSLPCQAANDPSFEQARQLESTGDFKKAIKVYEQLLQGHPDDENVKAALVWSWRQWNYRNPGDGDIVLGFGQELQRMKECDLALSEYFWARYNSPQSAAHADELIAGCYEAIAGDQQRILREVPNLQPWLATLKSYLENGWKPERHSGIFAIRLDFAPSGKSSGNEGRCDTGDRTEDDKVRILLSNLNLQPFSNFNMLPLPDGLRSLDVECVFKFQSKSIDLLVSGVGTDIETDVKGIVVEPIDSATLKKLLEKKGLGKPTQ